MSDVANSLEMKRAPHSRAGGNPDAVPLRHHEERRLDRRFRLQVNRLAELMDQLVLVFGQLAIVGRTRYAYL